MAFSTPRILGFGRQTSLAEVARLAAAEMERTHGRPQKLRADGEGIIFEADRSRSDGALDMYVVRLKAEPALLESVRKLASKTPALGFDESAGEGQCELRCSGDPKTGESAPLAALSHLIALPEVWHVSVEDPSKVPLSVQGLFAEMREQRASDLHLYPGAPPIFRVDGKTLGDSKFERVTGGQILHLLKELAPTSHWEEFVAHKQCSFNYHQLGMAFSRVSAFMKSGVPHLTLRFLSEHIPSFEDLHIPRPQMEELGSLHHGLVIVAGMTGSGKSTTVASIVDWINSNKTLHVLTIEDPIEFVHRNKKSIISQRGVGEDVETFIDGVRAALRHDPDVISIGEMRDPDTIRAAIDAASTGHLVLTTFHSNTAAEVVNRIISFFEPVERDLVRLQLRDSLKCVICQRLLPKISGGRMPALEFLFNDSKLISDSIEKGQSAGIRIGMQQTISQSRIFEQSLHELVKAKIISLETAQAHATVPAILDQMRFGTYVPPTLDRMIQQSLE
ncbi:MAG TPA: PilT/PilU family type 4a pilus ATPase [Planctomycetaceae bacterium]|nr:PilT/PilU family type 4a pilus ATPase [Planctomycetaceae bacterium]